MDFFIDLFNNIELYLSNFLNMLLYDKEAPMLFSSGLFWVLFLIFLPIYGLLRNKKWQMILFVCSFSIFFYYKSSGLFFILLLATSIIDWSLSKLINRTDNKWGKRTYLTLSILLSLSVLGYFKYANFFLWNWGYIIKANFQPLDIILPVGISFYTFQSISYVVDVYKQKLAPTRTWLEYLFFLSFFPQLVAGPIVRADKFLPQIEKEKSISKEEVYSGFWLIILGIIKKAIIADYIAQYNDLIFASPTGYSGFETLMGILGYTMQIYCDFSGYSDMAIGIAMILGFDLGINFKLPYQSKNITEFWRRWHISLSSWLRDYIYIPLGGNRKGVFRTYLNNFLTMLIGGLWHGAAWRFIFWGGMHGIGLILHKASQPILNKIPDNIITKFICWGITFSFVSLLWIFFRAESFEDSIAIIQNIFNNFSYQHIIPFFKERYIWTVMMLIIIISHTISLESYKKISNYFVNSYWIIKLIIFIIVIQLVIQFMSSEVAPFIYFQF